MQIEEKKLQAYDSIMQNLLVLKKEARSGEAAAIETVLNNLSVLRISEQDPGVFLVSGIKQVKDVNAGPADLGKIAVHAK